MKLKKVIGLGFLAAALGSAVLFGGCKSLKKKTVFLTVWEALDGPDSFIKQAAEKYSEKNPHVKINFVNVEANNVVWRMKEDASRGIGPDLFSCPHDNMGTLVSGGLISPIKNPGAVRGKVLPSCEKAVVYSGETYGFPVGSETYALFYNKALVSERDVPSTWEGLVKWAENFNEANPGKHGFVMDVSNAYYTFIFTTKNGNRLFGSDGTDAYRPNLNTKAAIDGMKFFQSLRKIVPLASEEMNTQAAESAFISGNAAFYIAGLWNVKTFSDAGLQFGVSTIPSLPGESTPTSSFSGIKVMMVNSYSEHPEEASDFAEFLISPEMQKLRFDLTGALPSVNISVSNPHIQQFMKQLEVAFPMPSIPEMEKYWSTMNVVSGRIWDGADVEEELAQADKTIGR